MNVEDTFGIILTGTEWQHLEVVTAGCEFFKIRAVLLMENWDAGSMQGRLKAYLKGLGGHQVVMTPCSGPLSDDFYSTELQAAP